MLASQTSSIRDMSFHITQRKTAPQGYPLKHGPLVGSFLFLHVLPLITRSMHLPLQQGDTLSYYHGRKAAILGLSLQTLTLRPIRLHYMIYHP